MQKLQQRFGALYGFLRKEAAQTEDVAELRKVLGLNEYNRPVPTFPLRYERVLVYEDLGQGRRAQSEIEKLYAEDPDYEDVAARLGL